MKKFAIAALLLGAVTIDSSAQSTRMASDFEMAETENRLARSPDFLSQLSGHLNLGDLRESRNESALARAEYEKARSIAMKERLAARRDSSLSRYASATAWAALAEAKLGRTPPTIELMEEALRYASDDDRIWNLYATAMSQLRLPRKAASLARNAVSLAAAVVAREPTVTNRLDLAVYQHSLAVALLESNSPIEAERLLTEVADSLRSSLFAPLRQEIAHNESFEIYSSARGDAAAYLSLINRVQLRLGALREARGDHTGARLQYERVLEARSDDPLALAAMARLSTAGENRDRYFADAFDANPFSLDLVRDYQRYLDHASAKELAAESSSPGSRVRLALQQHARGNDRASMKLLDGLIVQFPGNDTLRLLRREAASAGDATPGFLISAGIQSREGSPITPTTTELQQLLALMGHERLSPEQRVRLDTLTFRTSASFDANTHVSGGQTTVESGSLAGVTFRFSEPTTFRGEFSSGALLTYRVLGLTQQDDRDALLLEPLGLEVKP
jgi:hypothetical protein